MCDAFIYSEKVMFLLISSILILILLERSVAFFCINSPCSVVFTFSLKFWSIIEQMIVIIIITKALYLHR